jgi:multiple sugar transport system substrate-binding protein
LLWREATRKIQAPKVHRLDTFADEVVNTELDKVLYQGKAIDVALQDAHRLLERRAKR